MTTSTTAARKTAPAKKTAPRPPADPGADNRSDRPVHPGQTSPASSGGNVTADQPADEQHDGGEQLGTGTLVTHTYEDERNPGTSITRYGIVAGRRVQAAVYADGRPIRDRETNEDVVLDRPIVVFFDSGQPTESLDDDAYQVAGG